MISLSFFKKCPVSLDLNIHFMGGKEMIRRMGKVMLAVGMILLAVPAAVVSGAEMMSDDKDGMMGMSVGLREAAESKGYMVMWNAEERSVTLTMKSMKNSMTDMKMDDSMTDMKTEDSKTDMKMEDSMTDMKMEDSMTDMKMESMNGAKMIKLYIGKTTFAVDGKEMMLEMAPYIKDGRTYISKMFVDMYL